MIGTHDMLAPRSAVDLASSFEAHLLGVGKQGRTTAATYARLVRQYLAFLGEAAPGAATRLDVEAYLAVRGADGSSSKATWNLRLAAVRALYGWLKRLGAVPSDPTEGLTRYRIAPRDAVPPTLDEVLAMVDVAKRTGPRLTRTRNAAIIEVFFNTGMRISELASLDVAQLDLQGHFFTDVVTKGDRRETKHTNDVAVEALERWLVERPYLADDGEPALFVSTRGGRLSVRAVHDVIAGAGRRAGIARPIHAHLLRYAAATELAKLNVPVPDIQDVCGHASITTTQRYIRMGDGRRSRALETLSSAIHRRRAEREAKQP